MKKSLSILMLLISILFTYSYSLAGRRCTGSSNCTACTNCSGCKYCNDEGGTCGVCSFGEDTYEEPEPEVVTTPTVYTPENNTTVSSESTDYSENDYTPEKKEETSLSWLWWSLGIGGFIFLGIIGKK